MVKVSPLQAMKAHEGCGCKDPQIYVHSHALGRCLSVKLRFTYGDHRVTYVTAHSPTLVTSPTSPGEPPMKYSNKMKKARCIANKQSELLTDEYSFHCYCIANCKGRHEDHEPRLLHITNYRLPFYLDTVCGKLQLQPVSFL